MNKTIIAVAAVSLLGASQAVDAREFADIYTECGLGAMIAPNNAPVAAVTNVTWDLGTTAVTSNASTPEACHGGKERTVTFIHDAYESLEGEIAQGTGPYLTTLLTLAECGADATASLRTDLASLVAAPDYSEQARMDQAAGLYRAVEKACPSA